MHYFKSFLFCMLLVFGLFQSSKAENWINVDNNNKRILLDTNSIKQKDDSIYYNIRYYEDKAKEDLVVTIQSKGEIAGVVSTDRYSQYLKNKSLANIDTSKKAKALNYLTSESLLYNANSTANSLIKKTNNQNNGIDFTPYMTELEKRIKSDWFPPKDKESNEVIVLIKIAKSGALESIEILKSSGLYEADTAAIKAVKLASPFDPLPEKYTNDSINIEFKFDYNILHK